MGREFFNVTVCDQGRVAASLAALIGQPTITGISSLLSAATGIMMMQTACLQHHEDPTRGMSAAGMEEEAAALATMSEESILRYIVPQLKQTLALATQRHDLVHSEVILHAGILREEALAFLQLGLACIESMEQLYRQWLRTEYAEFAAFAATNEPVWRAAALEGGRARQEAERSRREQTALQAAVDAWRGSMRDQRLAVFEQCTRQKKEWADQRDDWVVCIQLEEGDQRLAAQRREQQRLDGEWMRGYNPVGGGGAAPASSTSRAQQQPQQQQQAPYYGYSSGTGSSSTAGTYVPGRAGYSATSGGSAYTNQPTTGYYQPQQRSSAQPAFATTVTGANYGVARPTQPSSVPGAKVGFQASSAGQYQAPSSLFSSSLGKK